MNPFSKFQVGKDYRMSFIDLHLNDPLIMPTNYGAYIVGNNFLTYDDDRDNTVSFVLSGATTEEGIYTCVYNDVEPNESKQSYVILGDDNFWHGYSYDSTLKSINQHIDDIRDSFPNVKLRFFQVVRDVQLGTEGKLKK